MQTNKTLKGDIMSQYSIEVVNNSGKAQNIAIYQTYPNLTAGLPLIWISKNINFENSNKFDWETPWGLNWGTTSAPLAPGVVYESSGPLRAIEPNTHAGKNMMDISYNDNDFKSSEAYSNAKISLGSMQVKTDTSFTVDQSDNMSISVYMNGKPTFAMQGEPNGLYQFDTHPTYWICTTREKDGTAVSGHFVSSPTKVVFQNGITELKFELTDTLEFKQQK
jgi:rhizosphere induced protein